MTDAGLVHLAGIATLRSLTLSRCGVGDAGIERLAGLGISPSSISASRASATRG